MKNNTNNKNAELRPSSVVNNNQNSGANQLGSSLDPNTQI